MDATNTWRIVLLGKAGAGKSSLANTIIGEELFKVNRTLNSDTTECQAKTKSISGRSITLIDNPGFFGPGRSEEVMKREIVRCITECAPGPHAFLIVLKVERFTEHEKAVIAQICEHFSEDALKHSAVVFTHGDQLPEGLTIEKYVDQSEGLRELVKKCGGRCSVVDNKYWRNNEQDEYRSNQFQVAELLNTAQKIVKENNGGHYTNTMLQAVEKEIQQEEERIRQLPGSMPQEEIRKQARSSVLKKRVDNAPSKWIRGYVGWVVTAGLLAIVSAILIKSKFGKVAEELTLTPLIDLVAEEISETSVSTPASAVEKVDEGAIQDIFEVIMDKLIDRHDRLFNPWNPFE